MRTRTSASRPSRTALWATCALCDGPRSRFHVAIFIGGSYVNSLADLATWTAGEARTFLHAVIRALGAHGVYRTAITMSAQMMWTVNVEADTSVATSAPMALATDAAIKLEKLAFRLPDSRGLH